jgi:hypothetical protein
MRLVIAISALALITGCAAQSPKMPMATVLKKCDNASFAETYDCAKSLYATDGTRPDSVSVRSFFAQTDVVRQRYDEKKFNDIEAKAEMFKIYDVTIEASQPRACFLYRGMMVC